MKRLLISIFLILILTSCSQLNTTMDIIDIFTEPIPIHSGEVLNIIQSIDVTTIIFVDGTGYEIRKNIYIDPGDEVKVFLQEDGSYRAK